MIKFIRRICFCSFVVLFISCATFVRSSDADINSFTPQWQQLCGGVEFAGAKITKPAMEFYALKIDLTDSSIEIVVNDPDPKNLSGIIPSIKVSSFAKKYDCIAAVNAGPFYPSSAKEGELRKISGLFISNGQLVSPPSGYDALVFYKDGRTAIVHDKDASVSDIKDALGGFYMLLKDGIYTPAPFADIKRHPRSAAGLSADSTTLYILVIDGRRLESAGALLYETAEIMQKLGANSALNFDGGGSSVLALAVKTFSGKISPKIVNIPVHGFYGSERAVASCLGVRKKSDIAPLIP
ncbi:MAG: phosphodiester glycosidase family protein [Spirochaetaceae bacterium]|jgi:exopolysaccharide biosynthesis protein|nr:phosphodiester glycosidase family protein [Spirochaetaceae bacterium]